MNVLRLFRSREIARSGVVSLTGSVLGSLSSFIVVAVVTRSMGLSMAGLLFQAIGLVTVLSVFVAWGAPAGLMRFSSRHRDLSSDATWTYFVIGTTPVVVMGIAIAAMIELLAPWLSSALTTTRLEPEMALLLRVLAPFVPLAAWIRCATSLSRGLGRSAPQALYNTGGQQVARLILCLGASIVGAPYWAFGLCWVIAAAVSGLGSGLALVPLGIRRVSRYRITNVRARSREFWSFTLPRGGEVVLQQSAAWLLVVLVGALSSAEQAALYTVASRSAQAMTFILQATTFALGPKLSQLFGSGRYDEARRLYQTSTVWLIAVSFPVSAVLLFFPSAFLDLFSKGYAQGGPEALVVLTCAMMVNLATGPVGAVILMAGRTTWNLGDAIAGFCAAILLTVILVPQYGALGAAIAWGVSIVVQNGLGIWQIQRHFDMWPITLNAVRDAALGISVAAASKLVLQRYVPSDRMEIVLGAAVMAAVTLALIVPRIARYGSNGRVTGT